ncbi:hypothetical protein GQ457_07G011900 [Hibiscus cannabinus]
MVEMIRAVVPYAPGAIGAFQEDGEGPESSTVVVADVEVAPPQREPNLHERPPPRFPGLQFLQRLVLGFIESALEINAVAGFVFQRHVHFRKDCRRAERFRRLY